MIASGLLAGQKDREWSRNYPSAATLMLDLHARLRTRRRDQNSFANVLQCFGRHDCYGRKTRSFGKMRVLLLEGMKRKSDTKAYIEEIRGMKIHKDHVGVV